MTWIPDHLLPAYDFRTRYTRQVNAAPTQVRTALHVIARHAEGLQ